MIHEDDVFNDNSPVIVDCDLLEAAKENVRPLGTGRRVTALSAILATPHALRESKLSATRNRLRINVELALDDEEDGDPLDAYCRLVYWTMENYPEGPSVESGLLELLEEATRVLKDDRGGKWRGDLKYLKLWLLYASFVERPTLIYRFLIANEIGTNFALLYEEYAAVLERDGRRKDADEAYALGIARRAEPLDHLKSRHDDFQKRMMSNTLPRPAPAAPSAPTTRPVLASTSTSRSSTASSTQAPSRGSNSSRAPSSNAPLQIFVDPTGSESQAAEFSSNTWTDLGTRKSRIKENVPETKKLAGTTLKQAGRSKRAASGSGSGAAASGSKIAIYRDPVPEDMPPPSVPEVKTKAKASAVPKTPSKSSITPFVDGVDAASAAPAVPSTPSFTPFRDEAVAEPRETTSLPVPESVMKVKKAAGKAPGLASEMEALRKDPLKNYPDLNIEDG
ncbi:putative mad3/BUB1 hoMad3/BUB1 homology region 1 [Lyophyllum shimeji]|uniref:Mad3/BUB1 hoMad3/BUB1 homology region 1 n=1 Tax=Lyophyllum shimeji TaxID=47721 RepID=A0A9P3PU89_LYOSH|nr:putative mad3/BUB1 hoMad3/BUB1 homology region 1 [Lyophyllum shimeji]